MGFRAQDLGSTVFGLGFTGYIPGFGFRVSGFVLRVLQSLSFGVFGLELYVLASVVLVFRT